MGTLDSYAADFSRIEGRFGKEVQGKSAVITGSNTGGCSWLCTKGSGLREGWQNILDIQRHVLMAVRIQCAAITVKQAGPCDHRTVQVWASRSRRFC